MAKSFVPFSFLKTKGNKKLQDSSFEKKGEKKEEQKDFVLSLEEKQIKSSISTTDDTELIIPLKLRSSWNIQALKSENVKKIDENDLSLEAKAAREIIQELTHHGSEDEGGKSDLVIPAFIENRIPEGYETEEKLDVSMRAEESTLEDYEKVPIDKFGLALMRGMGWKMGDPIGKTNKGISKPIEHVLRPKLLGLGADRTEADRMFAQYQNTEEDITIKKGSYVQVNSGTHKDKYGQVEGFDEEGVRALIKLAIGGKIVNVSQYIMRRVSKKEFQEKGKLINGAKYEEYKLKQESEKLPRKRENADFLMYKEQELKHRRQSPDPRLTHNSENGGFTLNKKNYVSSESDSCSSGEDVKPWILPEIRVRFINKKYKQGHYFNTKMTVIDIADLKTGTCICQTESGRLLEDIPFSWLETVIPRHSPYVRIVKGEHYGKVGNIMEKDKNRCTALVQLLQDKDVILKFDYDSICEYVGNVEELYSL